MPLKNSSPRRGTFVIILTFAVAFTLSQIPMPAVLSNFVPDWAVLVLIYWTLAIPHRIGMVSAFIVGILIDSMTGVILGQNALSMVVISYLVLSFYQRIRISPTFQQALTVMGLLFLYYLLLFWFDRLTVSPLQANRDVKEFLLPPIGGFIIWPWLFYFLRAIRRRYNIK